MAPKRKAQARQVKSNLLADGIALLDSAAWSVFTELGAPGWRSDRRHSSWSADPEAALLLALFLRAHDERLFNAAANWYASYAPLISTARWKRIVSSHSNVASLQGNLDEQLSLAASRYGTSQPIDTAAIRNDSALQLRARSLLGVTVKADIVTAVLTLPTYVVRDTGNLARFVRGSRQAVHVALADLVAIGVIEPFERVGRSHHALGPGMYKTFSKLLGPLPQAHPPMISIVELAVDLVSGLSDIAHEDSEVRSVQARQLARQIAASPLFKGVFVIPDIARAQDAYTELSKWTNDLLASFSMGGLGSPFVAPEFAVA